MRKGERGAPLCLAHPVGGTVLCYGTLMRLVDRERPVIGFQARGAEREEPPRHDVAEMAAAYLHELGASHSEAPVVLAGWSFGGTLAYEMACQLEEGGRKVALLCLLDATAPMATGGEVDEAELMAQLLYDLSGMLSASSPSLEQLRKAPVNELYAIALAHVGSLGLFRPGTEEAEIRRHVSLYRAHMNAHLRYHPRPYHGPVLYVTAAGSRHRRDILERWRALSRGPFEEVLVPGARHANLLQQPHVALVADSLHQRLAKLQTRS
jgi:thioesterase domain-containing protein